MSTLEALNAISEAIEAHKILPDIQRQLKEAREALEFAILERDEERHTNETLKTLCDQLEDRLVERDADIRTLRETIAELNDRNTNLDTSLNELAVAHSNTLHDLQNKEQVISILSADKAALLLKLEDSRGVVAKLTDTLRNIGQSIVAAVEPPVPEVANPTTFPVPVGLPNPADATLERESSVDPVQPMAEPTDADLVGVAEDNSSSFNTPPKDETAPGTFPYRYW